MALFGGYRRPATLHEYVSIFVYVFFVNKYNMQQIIFVLFSWSLETNMI